MPNFAAWIEDVDLTQPLSDAVQAELRQALFDFEVIFFRPQAITPAQHVALAKVFGPVSAGSYFARKPGAPELEMSTGDFSLEFAPANGCSRAQRPSAPASAHPAPRSPGSA